MWGSVSRSEGDTSCQEMPTRLNKRPQHRLYECWWWAWGMGGKCGHLFHLLSAGHGQDGDSEALKARCSISRSHLVFCSGSFSLLFFPPCAVSNRFCHYVISLQLSSLSLWRHGHYLSHGRRDWIQTLRRLDSGRFWLTLDGPWTRRVTSRAQRKRMTERASHPWWKMLLVKLSPRPKVEKMGLLQSFEKVYCNTGEKHISCPPLSVFIFTLHPPSATPSLYFYPL